MDTFDRTSRCRVVSIISAAAPAQSRRVLALLRPRCAIDLADLTLAIKANPYFCYLVTEAACLQFGWPRLTIEDAVVLLGRRGLYALLADPDPYGRSATQLRRAFRTTITSTASLSRSRTSQGKVK